MYTYIAINSLLSWGSYYWERSAIYSLLLSWGFHCWGRLPVTAYCSAGDPVAGTGLLFTYSFAKLWVPAGTRLIMQPLAGSLVRGIVRHVRRHFRIFFVDRRFLGGGGGSSPYSSLGMKMVFKN